MIEKELIELKSLQIDLDDEKSIKLFAETLYELKNKGYDKVKIEIKTSTEQELKRSGLDVKVFQKIKVVQDLPDWAVINLMLAGGKIKRK